MKSRLVIVLCVVTVLAALLAACGPKKAEATVEMKEFSFSPDRITVPAGGEVTLHLKNAGTLEHEYVIMLKDKQATLPFDDDDETNIYWEQELDPGKDTTVTFTAPSDPGEYEVVCGTPGHLEQNMKATLVVE